MEYAFIASIFDLLAEDLESINMLTRQLSGRARTLDMRALSEVIEHGHLLIVRLDGRIVGIATLVPVIIPVGKSGRIEDVVVDEEFRGQGIGRALIMQLILKARVLDMDHVDLTSNPKRIAANKLYPTLGF